MSQPVRNDHWLFFGGSERCMESVLHLDKLVDGELVSDFNLSFRDDTQNSEVRPLGEWKTVVC